MDLPQLIEINASSHIQQTLHKCHVNRLNFYYYVLNISVLLLFILIVGFTLYYCYNNKLSDYDKQQRLLKDQEFIVSKIRYFQEENHKNREQTSSFIGDLPSFHT